MFIQKNHIDIPVNLQIEEKVAEKLFQKKKVRKYRF